MKEAFLCFLSAALLTSSFPPIGVEFLAFFAFVPFFFAIKRKSFKEIFWLSLLTGFLFFFGLLHWVHHVTWPGTFLLILYLSCYVALFGIGVKFLSGRWVFMGFSSYEILWIPSLWVVLEFLRSHLFTGFGWGLLGYSQWKLLPFIQLADLTGAYGVSFLVMFGNVLLYGLLRKNRTRGFYFLCLVYALLIISVLVYGKIRLVSYAPRSVLRASVIQGNIPQEIKWDVSVQDLIMQKYERLTEAAATHHPDMIFWPETAVPGFLPDEEELLERLVALNQKTKAHLLVGAPWNEEGVTTNSALLLKDGQILQRYDKLHLVPYGEFIPFEEQFPILRNWIVTGDFYPGKEVTIFRHPKGTFSVLICFEDIFPGLVRRFAKDSDFLVNLTNDAWFGKSGAPFQHAQASVFRAIENRRSVLRVTNTGYTCLIDPLGRIIQELTFGREALFVTGHRTWDVPLFREQTFYTRHGDWFVGFCIILTLLALPFSFISFLRKK